MLKNAKIDPGKLIGSFFGRQKGLNFMYFGNDDEWRFFRSVTGALKDTSYFYCGTAPGISPHIVSVGTDPFAIKVDSVMDVVSVDSGNGSFSTIFYLCAEGLLADGGLLCVDGPGIYRYPLFKAMMKEGVITTFGQNEFEERGMVLFRKQTGKFSRIM